MIPRILPLVLIIWPLYYQCLHTLILSLKPICSAESRSQARSSTATVAHTNNPTIGNNLTSWILDTTAFNH
ncbi:hypothetical protein TSUD_204160 [Trifolium subterraneum]|uniref:Secreted protein n=1 Tax=Trifolium subterraneum TaxID=3900 RepID=A0A2Z6MK92_TRISU|nr:hypothetical protein TSUD_204160 [Trifolium subterraneum]